MSVPQGYVSRNALTALYSGLGQPEAIRFIRQFKFAIDSLQEIGYISAAPQGVSDSSLKN